LASDVAVGATLPSLAMMTAVSAVHTLLFSLFFLFWCNAAIDDGDCQAKEKKK
jgi:hypothetical protein